METKPETETEETNQTSESTEQPSVTNPEPADSGEAQQEKETDASADASADGQGKSRKEKFAEEIARLLQPGHEFLNLNPFEVLQIPLDFTPRDLKVQYRKLSIIVHPDKNPGEPDAQKAFDIVSEANKAFKDADMMRELQSVAKEAKRRVEEQSKKGYYIDQLNGGKIVDPEACVPDGNEAAYEATARLVATKIFIERKARSDEIYALAQAHKRREEEQRIKDEADRKRAKLAQKEWEAKREDRVSGWRSWQNDGSKNQKDPKKPRLKMEKR